jgi:hypothetical protein
MRRCKKPRANMIALAEVKGTGVKAAEPQGDSKRRCEKNESPGHNELRRRFMATLSYPGVYG